MADPALQEKIVQRLDEYVLNFAADHGQENAFQRSLHEAAEAVLTLVAHETATIQAKVDSLEKLRPVWAQGFTNDSIAAQTTASALAAVWSLLGATNQTEAMERLRTLIATRDEAVRVAGELADAAEALFDGSVELLVTAETDEKLKAVLSAVDAVNAIRATQQGG